MNKLILVLVLILPNIAFSESIAEENGVLILTQKNYFEAIHQHDYIMVELYAPWCNHCKIFESEYIKIGKRLKNENISAVIAKVDGTTEKDLALRLKISSFPTIFFYIKGIGIPYEGSRNEEAVVTWIKRKMEPVCREAKTKDDIERARNNSNVVVILWQLEDEKQHQLYQDVSKSFEEVLFLYGTSDYLRQQYDVPNNVKLSIFKTFDEVREDYKDEIEYKKLNKLVKDHEFPAVTRWENKFAKRVFIDFEPAIVIMLGSNMESDWALKALYDVKSKLRGNILLAYAYPEGEFGEKIIEYLQINPHDLPAV